MLSDDLILVLIIVNAHNTGTMKSHILGIFRQL